MGPCSEPFDVTYFIPAVAIKADRLGHMGTLFYTTTSTYIECVKNQCQGGGGGNCDCTDDGYSMLLNNLM